MTTVLTRAWLVQQRATTRLVGQALPTSSYSEKVEWKGQGKKFKNYSLTVDMFLLPTNIHLCWLCHLHLSHLTMWHDLDPNSGHFYRSYIPLHINLHYGGKLWPRPAMFHLSNESRPQISSVAQSEASGDDDDGLYWKVVRRHLVLTRLIESPGGTLPGRKNENTT